MNILTLPISNTGVSAADILVTVRFLQPKLGLFSDTISKFQQLVYRDSKVPKHFVGLIEMQFSPSFDCNWGKQNDPTACWYQLHPRYWVSQREKSLSYPPDAWAIRGLCLLQTPIKRVTTPLKFLPYSIFRAKGGQKTINFLKAIFMGIFQILITNIWSAL